MGFWPLAARFFLELGHIAVTYWPGTLLVLLTILPSLITGLTNYPRADAALKVLLDILDRLSGLAHKDSPGTFKPPVMLSRAPAPRTLQTSVMSAGGVPIVGHSDDVTPGARPGTIKVIMFVGLTALSAHAAQAQVLSMGPSLPLLQVRLADPATGRPATGVLSAGAGYQLGVGFFQRSLLGKEFDLLDLDFLAFGTIAQEAGFALDRASVAGAVCTLNSLVCLGYGLDLVQFFGGDGGQLTGLLAGNVGRQNQFAMLSLGFNFAIGPSPSSVPAPRLAEVAERMDRGNTVYIGW